MKLRELNKIYDYHADAKRFIINVELEDYRDAYSEWDFSPFTNRDLDDDLIEYILECSYEIPLKYNLGINFHILYQEQSTQREDRSIIGMRNFFMLEIRKLQNKKMRVYRDILTFLVIGSCLLVAGYYLSDIDIGSVAGTIVSEGLSIGGWVMFWEMFSSGFFEMKDIRIQKKHFERLNKAWLVFSYDKG